MESFQNVHDKLFEEHIKQYEYFTRFLLTLSVGFITFTATQLAETNNSFGIIFKVGFVLQGLSLLLGILLQYSILTKPLKDLEKVAQLFASSEKIQNGEGEYFARPPSLAHRCYFMGQLLSFLAAFLAIFWAVLA